MRKIIFGRVVPGSLGYGLVIASLTSIAFISAAMASEHRVKHHQPSVRENIRPVLDRNNPGPFNPENQNAFGSVTPWEWRTGIQADDWRQSVNGR